MPYQYGSIVKIGADRFVIGCCVLVIIVSTVCIGCGGIEPIPEAKRSFVGRWKSDVGITIEIFQNGTADLQRGPGRKPEADTLDIRALDPKGFRVYFNGDSVIELIQPFNIARDYKINKFPSTEGDQMTMTLNGVVLVKE